ncbi:MAG: hypothetical protein KF691_08590 [Phycisphaeraceae bacterium]|nr:hypothetical protein [Phycisphaeraceae bacterium]
MQWRSVTGLAAVAGFACSAMADINGFNGFNMVYRNFNDYPNSIITPTINGSSGVRIMENMGPVNPDNPQKFANRHFAQFSDDNGVTRLSLQNNQSFKISYKMRINSNIDNDGSGMLWPQQPEGGLWFFNNNAGDFSADGGIFVVGNGTVFVGGANQNFSLIAEGNISPAFTKGDILQMSYTYYAPGVAGALAAYAVQFTNLTTNFTKTVFNTFDAGNPALNGFIDGAGLGFRFQNTRNPLLGSDGTVNDTEYWDVVVVPTPGAASLLALGGLVAARRRRA